eukprot:s791_g10.t1
MVIIGCGDVPTNTDSSGGISFSRSPCAAALLRSRKLKNTSHAGEAKPQTLAEDQGLSYAISMAMREQYPEGCSVYVGGLDGEDEMYPEQLYEHFKECGEVKRVCIKIDKFSGERLGHAYVDFADESQAEEG